MAQPTHTLAATIGTDTANALGLLALGEHLLGLHGDAERNPFHDPADARFRLIERFISQVGTELRKLGWEDTRFDLF